MNIWDMSMSMVNSLGIAGRGAAAEASVQVLRWQRMQTNGTGRGTGADGGASVMTEEVDVVDVGMVDWTGCADILLGGRSSLLTLGLYKGSTQWYGNGPYIG